jgi:hypothetical protein
MARNPEVGESWGKGPGTRGCAAAPAQPEGTGIALVAADHVKSDRAPAAVVTVPGPAYNAAAPVTLREGVIMDPVSTLRNFVFVAGVLSGGVFLALIIYGHLKEKDFDNLT